MTSDRKNAYTALIFNAIFWGAAIPVVKLALPYTTPFRWLFYRYLIAVPLSLPFLLYYITYKFKPKLKQVLMIAGLELIGTSLVLGLLYEGLKRTTAIDASLLTITAPVFVVVAGVLFLHEKEEKREWIGFAIAIFGAFIIAIEPVLNGGGTHGSLLGNALIVGRSIIWAGYLVVAKRVYKDIPKPLVTSISFWVALATFAILTYFEEPSFVFADLAHPTVLFAASYMAVFGSIIGQTLYLYGQSKIEISEASIFSYLEALVAIPLAIVLLGDTLRPVIVAGIVIIFLGVYLAERRPHRV